MRISVVTPTRNRHHLLPDLYASFSRQSHSDKELLVLDDGHSPSEWMLSLDDSRVRYMHSSRQMPLGEKRNALVNQSTGDIVAQFDDDDFYHEDYLMSSAKLLSDNDFMTLTGWFVLHAASRRLFYWDCERLSEVHFRLAGIEPVSVVRPSRMVANINGWLEMQVWGYGFSYVFRKEVCMATPFKESAESGEDFEFASRVRRAGWRAIAVADVSGTVIHAIHGSNASAAFPNFSIPLFALGKIGGVDAVRWADRMSESAKSGACQALPLWSASLTHNDTQVDAQ
jgi:glycosyltransferase involved in cell wall biosynthesis